MDREKPCARWLVALGLLSASCASAPGTVRTWVPAFAFGAIDGGEVDVRDICSSGRATRVSVGSSWSTLGISIATLGVYTPREVRIECAR